MFTTYQSNNSNITRGVFVSVKNSEFVPYCSFNIIDKFICYLQRNDRLKDYGYSDFINFLAQL